MSRPDHGKFRHAIPAGDDRVRRVCGDCGFVDYENPKVVVGAIVTFEDRILLCRRAIPPRVGWLTHPGGHLERGETAEEGAIRESWEEARARISIDSLIGVHTNAPAGVVDIVYAASLEEPSFGPGPESESVALYAIDEIPWNEVAFPVTRWAVERAFPDLAVRRRAAIA